MLGWSLRDPPDAMTAAAAPAATAAVVFVGVKLDLRLRPRKANLDLCFGVACSGRCGTGGGGCKSELVFGSWRPRRKSEMSDVLERTRPEGERAGGIVVGVDVYV